MKELYRTFVSPLEASCNETECRSMGQESRLVIVELIMYWSTVTWLRVKERSNGFSDVKLGKESSVGPT